MSNHEPIFGILKKLTITVVHAVTDGSLDPFTLEDRFEYANRIRLIIGPVQVMGFDRSIEGGHNLVLRFSPDYLHLNYYKLLGLNADFEWTFTLPEYIVTDYVDENGDDQCDELGMVEWLTQSVVNIDDNCLATARWSHEELQASFDEFAQ
jgi:hypothetical protein